MSDIIKNAQQLLDGTTPAPWEHYDDHGIVSLTSGDAAIATDLNAWDADLIAAAPENTQALAEETYEYQVQTRSHQMPTWIAITDDTLQKWYPEDKYNDLIHTGRIIRGGAGFKIRVLCRRVSPPEVINE